ncbi:23S rRNA (cytosine1962-C5)-methyltransferase [Dysgonomonas sp. PFB1-18]|uniref:class I SAM-dependent methyltransferase n=1 Tax=unclassified Dysgonomonas TaxID=2630389 RepID=UPI0024764951|nr:MULTISPECIES: class I SAM-dependent methyltransferase [unclassified Dysgonomonas]MDH6308588.1 23S rRNA (cytosine1962-C5)-methyltransferase [Dysgonomonas sp. PF1-14]MDH6338089.1 23S rRNA (cytosine1962-C5)-methyltransferase [Dysgonomonas sp. PF1-16]MDH6379586.1 23S rRNA (cytosine1962-C5)-methyltransferase [Dysgonomonas sp. PFB1-18]MDH6396916.1 23S rRNA (cytosine1962-C5)-methyltransferase [Dysgonomonas sp. PF1-23]
MQLLNPQHWTDYELIDSGEYEKLERFGKYTIRRPEPQAVWRKSLTEKEWENMADASFMREKGKASQDGNDKGVWTQKKGMSDQWFIGYNYKDMNLTFRLGLTSFKHVGIFPEQSENWNYIYDSIKALKVAEPKVLNLFAYTGGASIAAKSAGADVTHVDSVRQVITWSRENMEASGLDNIRWIVEDALKFCRREVKREKKYNGIILDPPAYGRGPDGERWILEDNIAELMSLCSNLLEEKDAFLILNLYSMGFSAIIAENLIKDYFPDVKNIQFGELVIPEESGKSLPLSVYARFSK